MKKAFIVTKYAINLLLWAITYFCVYKLLIENMPFGAVLLPLMSFLSTYICELGFDEKTKKITFSAKTYKKELPSNFLISLLCMLGVFFQSKMLSGLWFLVLSGALCVGYILIATAFNLRLKKQREKTN